MGKLDCKGVKQDSLCITDMAAAKSGHSRSADVVRNWLRNRTTLEFLATWEEIYNPEFKVFESEHFKKQAGLLTFLETHNAQMIREGKKEDSHMTKEEWYRQLFEHLSASKFRSSFHLKQKDIAYIKEKGLDVIREHARDFIAKREAPAVISNDGKQTPMRGHPVFVAQHATATCCRECIRKWHKIQPGKELSQVQQEYLVDVIMTWIEKELSHYDSQM